jgi:hypothetical protein
MAPRSGTFGYRAEGRAGGVKVEGLAKVRRDLKNLSEEVDYRAIEFLPVNKTIADLVARDAGNYVPFLTGTLAGTIRAAASKTSARVKAGGGRGSNRVEYAGPIHFGWPARFIKPQPFFYDAIDKRRGEIQNRYDDLVKKLINKYDLGK